MMFVLCSIKGRLPGAFAHSVHLRIIWIWSPEAVVTAGWEDSAL